MFATLDPTSRRLRLPYDQEVIINDTVGFIRDLPEALVAAFRATLEEISDSDLIVHVVDAANQRATQQIASVDKILGDLELGRIPQIIALNKTDLISEDQLKSLQKQLSLDKHVEGVAISAINRRSLSVLAEEIAASIGDFGFANRIIAAQAK
jgi:GTP-binding protein HflX